MLSPRADQNSRYASFTLIRVWKSTKSNAIIIDKRFFSVWTTSGKHVFVQCYDAKCQQKVIVTVLNELTLFCNLEPTYSPLFLSVFLSELFVNNNVFTRLYRDYV